MNFRLFHCLKQKIDFKFNKVVYATINLHFKEFLR